LSYAWTNRLDEAERDMRAAEAIMPGAAVLHRIRAILADRRSDDEALIAETTKSLEIEPGNVMALRFRAYAYQRAKREAEAMADADAYVEAHQDDPDAYAFRAGLAVSQRKPAIAIEQAKRLETLFPDDSSAIAAAARIFDDLGQRDKALQLIGQSISIDPDRYYYYYLRAGIRKWDDLAGRQADLQKAFELDPTNAGTLTQLGLVEFKLGRWNQAIVYFTKVLEQEPRDFGLLAYRAMAHYKPGDKGAARNDLDAATRAASGPDDFSLICWALGREGQLLDTAVAACDKAVAAKPDEDQYRANRGIVRLRLGQISGALADYEAAVAADDRIAANFFGRALVRRRNGDLAGAKSDRAHALAIDPTVAEEFEQWGLGN
jgi:tetratricopeptide (TPR) repeat protein